MSMDPKLHETNVAQTFGRVIAVDYDGCLAKNGAWPEAGELDMRIVAELLKAREEGATLILWTCRTEYALEQAVKSCRDVGMQSLPSGKPTPSVRSSRRPLPTTRRRHRSSRTAISSTTMPRLIPKRRQSWSMWLCGIRIWIPETSITARFVSSIRTVSTIKLGGRTNEENNEAGDASSVLRRDGRPYDRMCIEGIGVHIRAEERSLQ